MTLLSCRNLGFRQPRGTVPVLEGIDLSLEKGELVGLLGLNGAGKSTLLRLLMGFLTPSVGDVFLEGRALREWSASAIARHLAYVPQSHVATFPYTVRRMVELGRVPYSGLTGRLSWEDRLAVDAALERMGLSGFADRPVTELSGGERQRVVLARAIAQDAQGLLLDEPMTGLDYGYQLRLMALLADLAREGRLVMLTSHRPEELYVRASRVLVLDHGRIDADGPPQDVVTAQRMSALYGVPLTQTDHAGNRFFHHGRDEK
ncbi:ABC transporter ATP-binding protein [Gluconobacter oxydans]|uniref:ABC-type Fe3+-siderophore transport system, ATP-binding protein n=1 Tax=Gluconobacter oxydans (strain 621H) TaxID=290633 RepID=Q5FTD6_GLUOX|nr:ABC transporter ATP-binding protein [Gluconobacter oxydans]AAW60360.1 ABC-type Fe3+-siderophore transport system, ATP-binding protein [Gluconobacter oxydans 621H]